MIVAEAVKIIQETSENFEEKNRIGRGLMILAKYDDQLDLCTSFEHDQMYTSDFDNTVAQMTKEEVTEMATLGWFESEDSWSHK